MRFELVAALLLAAPFAPAALAAPAAPEPAWQRLADGLEAQELAAGDGAEARVGSTVEVHYTGWLADGTRFDSSRDRDRTYSFRLGVGSVIPGWDRGIVGMKRGGVRRLRIDSELAYGARGASGVVPPDATLLFEVELVGLR